MPAKAHGFARHRLRLPGRGTVSSAFAVAEVERSTCEGMLKDRVTVAAVGLLRLKGLL
jgi:hypothetical protein